MDEIRDLAERLWRGDLAPTAQPQPGTLFEITPDVALVTAFGNSIAIRAGGGLLVIDASSRRGAERVIPALRAWDTSPVHTIIATHGHADHVGGLAAFDRDARERGYAQPHVIAHEYLPQRLDRYTRTAGYNALINARQFGSDVPGAVPGAEAWTHWRRPDQVYRDELDLDVGGEVFRLRHARGETDDHTWAWWGSRRFVFPGDLFIWRTPNAGNPQKVQRYPWEWALALREMAALGPEVLVPSHSLPVFGAARVQQALDETARVLETLVEQTLALMNRGARLDEIIHSVRAPADLLERPYLQPAYDEPEFIVRSVWRMYGGWWDGNAANLKPAPDAEVAREIATLAGGARRLADRALALAAAADLRLACHLAEFAGLAAPEDAEVQADRAAVYELRAESEHSLMARGIFNAAARE